MNYTLKIPLALPREKVIELFDNADNLCKWQPGLVSFEHLSGEPGQEGAKAKLEYKYGSRVIDMIETIETRNLPDEFTGIYEPKGARNRVVNRFVEKGPNETEWVMECEFRCTGFLRLMAFFMPGMFEKKTSKDIQ